MCSFRFQRSHLSVWWVFPHKCLMGSSNLIFLETDFSLPQVPPSKPSKLTLSLPVFVCVCVCVFSITFSVRQTNLKSSLATFFAPQPVVALPLFFNTILWGQSLHHFSYSCSSLLTGFLPANLQTASASSISPLTIPYYFSWHLLLPDK